MIRQTAFEWSISNFLFLKLWNVGFMFEEEKGGVGIGN
jgi:hypothetical protein